MHMKKFVLGLAAMAAAMPRIKTIDKSLPANQKNDFDPDDHLPGYCGNFATANADSAWKLWRDWIGTGTICRVGGRSCVRVRCEGTTGMYLCNEAAAEWCAPCPRITAEASKVHLGCNNRNVDKNFSGQVYIDVNQTISVVLAYANCRHSPHRPPETYDGPGPNGWAYKFSTENNPRHGEWHFENSTVDYPTWFDGDFPRTWPH